METSQITQMYKVVNEFLKDLLIPFPEYEMIIKKWWDFDKIDNEKVENVYNHLKKTILNLVIEILNQNTEIFEEDSSVRTDFFPQIDFKYLWNSELSDKTREMIWKYLQLILLTILNMNTHGEETMENVLNKMDTEEIQEKLNQTVENMKNLFSKTEENENLNDFHSNMKTLLDGKLGNLAKEMAEDTFKNLDIDPENPFTLWENLFKDPSQLKDMISTVGNKLNEKMSTGDISEEDMLNESVNLFQNLKDNPLLNNFTDLLKNVPGMNKKKMDVKGMEQKYNQMKKNEMMRERLRKKKEKLQEKKTNNKMDQSVEQLMNDEEIIKLFNQK